MSGPGSDPPIDQGPNPKRRVWMTVPQAPSVGKWGDRIPEAPIDRLVGLERSVVAHPDVPHQSWMMSVPSPLGPKGTRGPIGIVVDWRTQARARRAAEILTDMPPEVRERRGRAIEERQLRRY